jgi:hypothetical protein
MFDAGAGPEETPEGTSQALPEATGSGDLVEALELVEAALDDAFAIDPAHVSGPALDAAVRLAGRIQARADALAARVVGEWDSQLRWAGHGSRSAAAALAHGQRVPAAACRRTPRLARKLRAFPGVAAAWEAGRITTVHVQRICAMDNPRVHDALVADQVVVVRWAMTCAWAPSCRHLAEWLEEHDPNGAEPDGRAKRRFHCSKTIGDQFALDGWLDPIGGSVFAKELERLERKLYDADRAEARERLGYEPLLHELARTPEQRRADALVLMAERSATGPEDGRRGSILLTVLVGHDSLARILEATNGIPLRAGQLVPWLDALAIEQVLFDGPNTVVKVSQQRTFEGVLRKAVAVRDRGCQHPMCDEPIDRCQVDHIVPWSAGGPTSQENGRLLCGHHNRLRHRRREPRGGADP